MGSHQHETAALTEHGGRRAGIDTNIATLVASPWAAGIDTIGCCEGSIDTPASLQFAAHEHLCAALNMLYDARHPPVRD